MSTITRYLPANHSKRLQVLTTAKQKKDSLAPADNIFTPTTTSRLDIIQPQYKTALDTTANRQGESVFATAEKNTEAVKLRRLCSHYLQVFNFAVERGVYPAAARAYFNMDTATGKLPDLVSDADLQKVAADIATGENDLLAHGGPAMVNPSAAEVATAFTLFQNKFILHSNASQVLDTAQEAADALVDEADKVIKKIYDEAETHYNEEEPESQRNDCKWWGVIYITIGKETPVTVVLKQTGTGTPVAGAAIKLVEAAGKTLITGANGTVLFVTKVVGEATLEVFLAGSGTKTPDKTVEIVIEEEVPQTVEIEI